MTIVKINIESYFKSTWHTSPIQWEGVPFEVTTDKWISLAFIPIDRKTYAFDGADGRKQDTILIKITSYAKTSTLAIELEEEVRRFFECYSDLSFKVGVGVPNGDGIIPLDNGYFMATSLYEIQNFN